MRHPRPLAFSMLVAAAVLAAGCGAPQSGNAPPAAAQSQPPAASPQPAAPPATVAEPPAESPAQAAAPAPKKPASKPAPRESAPAERAAAPAEPPPPPPPVHVSVPAGTALEVEILDPLSSQTTQPGTAFRARVAKSVVIDGVEAIPAGAAVSGHVTEVHKLAKIGGQAKLTLVLESVDLQQGPTPIHAPMAMAGKKETGKDAATIGGAAAGGALLGQLLGHDKKATAIGAVVGAAAGTAVAAKTKGETIEVAAGAVVSVPLDQPVAVTVRR